MRGTTSFFKNSEVRTVNIPRYKQLTLKHVLDMAQARAPIAKYLPDQGGKDEPQVDRHFLFTIVNTVDPTYFPQQLKRIEQERAEAA